jgi:hypothetical protein
MTWLFIRGPNFGSQQNQTKPLPWFDGCSGRLDGGGCYWHLTRQQLGALKALNLKPGEVRPLPK